MEYKKEENCLQQIRKMLFHKINVIYYLYWIKYSLSRKPFLNGSNMMDISINLCDLWIIFHQMFLNGKFHVFFWKLYIYKYHLIMKSFWVLPWDHEGYLNRDDAMSWTVKPNISFHSLYMHITVTGVYSLM